MGQSPNPGRVQFLAICLLQREDLETKEERGGMVEETAQRTGKFVNNKDKRLVGEEKI